LGSSQDCAPDPYSWLAHFPLTRAHVILMGGQSHSRLAAGPLESNGDVILRGTRGTLGEGKMQAAERWEGNRPGAGGGEDG
jgi:hypothetical protein